MGRPKKQIVAPTAPKKRGRPRKVAQAAMITSTSGKPTKIKVVRKAGGTTFTLPKGMTPPRVAKLPGYLMMDKRETVQTIAALCKQDKRQLNKMELRLLKIEKLVSTLGR